MILERRVCARRSRDGGGNEKAFLNKAGSLSAGRSHAYTRRLIVTSCDGDRHCKHRDRPSALSPDPGCTGAVTSALPTVDGDTPMGQGHPYALGQPPALSTGIRHSDIHPVMVTPGTGSRAERSLGKELLPAGGWLLPWGR